MVSAVCSAARLSTPAPPEPLPHLYASANQLQIEAAVDTLLSGELGGLNQTLAGRSLKLQRAESLLKQGRAAESELVSNSNSSKAIKCKLASILNNCTIDELNKDLHDTEAVFERTQLKLDVARSSLKYIDASGEEDPTDICPACATDVAYGQLKLQLQHVESSGDDHTQALLAKRDELQGRLTKANELVRLRAETDAATSQQASILDKVIAEAIKEFALSSPQTLDSLDGYVTGLRKGCDELRTALESRSQAVKSWNSRVEHARRELQFHQLRLRKERVQRLNDTRYLSLHKDLKDLGDLRDIADKARTLLNSHLEERLKSDLPPVAAEMTETYLRLTEGPTFDSIIIHQGENADGSMSLDLRVSSSRGPGTWSVEHGILNGQALNAIQLVPYFVFSRYQEGPLLDLLLMDDPTQAFDTNKIKLLLKELADAASHASLFVATHEEDRFLPLLKDFFCADDVKAYRAVGIDNDGPQFEDVAIAI